MEPLEINDKQSRWRAFSFRIKLGILLIVLANLFLGSILLVPFLETPLLPKELLSLILFISGEVLFYTGLFLIGKELVQKYRKYFNPLNWFKKKD